LYSRRRARRGILSRNADRDLKLTSEKFALASTHEKISTSSAEPAEESS
jgi:hypothetical protein